MFRIDLLHKSITHQKHLRLSAFICRTLREAASASTSALHIQILDFRKRSNVGQAERSETQVKLFPSIGFPYHRSCCPKPENLAEREK